ncbi:pyridoxal kinase PdxY [Pararhizobium mangrovi]|uniref:pyridoxal kinase n=1 Tax=Pararhizobium mangrovi TaxID=2590452 RepID=A0A506TXZ5_9HYPH|nr:pyridoxal kinase PdxY [Pararhizobium mangrovi]TPW26068.1 pyridoxal kinase PdxY [Pararhizobium mangrovi]
MSVTTADAPRTVIVVSSHVVRGAVGNRAVVFALERLGHPVWAIPTVTLAWHPGHGPSHRIVPPSGSFDALIDDLAQAPWLGEVNAIVSGYFGDASQVGAVARLVRAVREKNPEAHYVCDPVMGDLAGLYVPEATAAAIRDALIPLASIATPNRHELAWLSEAPLEDNRALLQAALTLGPQRVVVTSAFAGTEGATGNLMLSDESALLAEHRMVDDAPNGLGDLFSAVFLSRLLYGEVEDRALQSATASVYDILARSVRRGSDELTLASDADCLSRPRALVSLRRLDHPGRRRA